MINASVVAQNRDLFDLCSCSVKPRMAIVILERQQASSEIHEVEKLEARAGDCHKVNLSSALSG